MQYTFPRRWRWEEPYVGPCGSTARRNQPNKFLLHPMLLTNNDHNSKYISSARSSTVGTLVETPLAPICDTADGHFCEDSDFRDLRTHCARLLLCYANSRDFKFRSMADKGATGIFKVTKAVGRWPLSDLDQYFHFRSWSFFVLRSLLLE